MKQKITFLAFFTCLIYSNSFSQPGITAQKTIGGSGGDYFTAICTTKDGGVLAGGTSYSNKSYEKTQNIRGNGDYWVVKLDKQGGVEWERTMGGLGWDNLKSLMQTVDGGYAIVGTSNSIISVEKSEDCRGETDFWLVKLDKSGNIEWDKTIGGSGTEYIDNFVQCDDGSFILAGSSNSYISGEKSEYSRGGFDYWFVKLDKAGHKIWDKTAGGYNDEFGSPVALTKDGGVIMGGFSNSGISGEKTEDIRGGCDYWTVKLNSNGFVEWDKTIGGNDNEFCHGICETDDGGYIMAGSSFSGISGEKSEPGRGGADYWVVKLDKNRNVVWDKTIGGNSDDWIGERGMTKTSSGNVMILGGSISSASGEKTENSRGGFDYWVVDLTTNGQLSFEKTIGGYYDDWGVEATELKKNQFMIGGFSYSPAGADKTGDSHGDADFWMVELSHDKSPVAPAISASNAYSQSLSNNVNKNVFTVYPNPPTGIMNIYVDSKAVISLIDQSGKMILSKTIDGKDVMDVSKLASGIYILKNNTTGETKKIMINK